MEITLKQFKSLISGLSADEMIDMMPESFDGLYKSKISLREMNYMSLYLGSGDCNFIKVIFLGLFIQGYLSDYQLITDEKNL